MRSSGIIQWHTGTEKIKLTKEQARQLKKELAAEEEAQAEARKCSDGEHCQKICSETELEALLEAGWHVVTALPSGKIVIER